MKFIEGIQTSGKNILSQGREKYPPNCQLSGDEFLIRKCPFLAVGQMGKKDGHLDDLSGAVMEGDVSSKLIGEKSTE